MGEGVGRRVMGGGSRVSCILQHWRFICARLQGCPCRGCRGLWEVRASRPTQRVAGFKRRLEPLGPQFLAAVWEYSPGAGLDTLGPLFLAAVCLRVHPWMHSYGWTGCRGGRGSEGKGERVRSDGVRVGGRRRASVSRWGKGEREWKRERERGGRGRGRGRGRVGEGEGDDRRVTRRWSGARGKWGSCATRRGRRWAAGSAAAAASRTGAQTPRPPSRGAWVGARRLCDRGGGAWGRRRVGVAAGPRLPRIGSQTPPPRALAAHTRAASKTWAAPYQDRCRTVPRAAARGTARPPDGFCAACRPRAHAAHLRHYAQRAPGAGCSTSGPGSSSSSTPTSPTRRAAPRPPHPGRHTFSPPASALARPAGTGIRLLVVGSDDIARHPG